MKNRKTSASLFGPLKNKKAKLQTKSPSPVNSTKERGQSYGIVTVTVRREGSQSIVISTPLAFRAFANET